MRDRALSRVRLLGCLVGGCTALAVLPAVWWSFSRQASSVVAAEAATPAAPTEIETVFPRRTTLMRSQVIPGTIEAFEQADLYAKTSGYVSEVRVDIGDRVKAGQVLAVIDSPELEKELQEARAQAAAQEAALGAADAKVKQAERLLDVARAQFARAKADLELRRLTLTRREELFAGKAITRQELDETRTQFEVAQADAGIAEARIAAAEADVIGAQAGRVLAGAQRDVALAHVERISSLAGYTRIVAPYDGLVTRRLVNRGDLVQAATSSRTSPLLGMQLVDTVRVVLHVPEAEAAFARKGARALVTPYVGDRTPIEGKVSRTAGALDASARTMRVEIDLPNPDARLLHGTYVHVKLELEARRDLLVVPVSALMTEGKERFVYVVRDERAVRVPVKTGLDDGGSIEITAGLNESDELVADGRAVRAPNAPVRPRPASRG